MVDAARTGRPDPGVPFITGFAGNALLADDDPEPGPSVLTGPFAVEAPAARTRERVGGRAEAAASGAAAPGG